MIEEMLKVRGVSQEELTRFARLPKHNCKEDIFGNISGSANLKRCSEFERKLAGVLAEVGEMEHPDICPKGAQRKFILKRDGEEGYKFCIAQGMANRMLRTLTTLGKYEQYDEDVTLNRIYQDTFCVEAIAR